MPYNFWEQLPKEKQQEALSATCELKFYATAKGLPPVDVPLFVANTNFILLVGIWKFFAPQWYCNDKHMNTVPAYWAFKPTLVEPL